MPLLTMFSQGTAVFATLSSGAIATAAEPPTIPLLPMAAIDVEDAHGLPVRCRPGMQGVTSGTAFFRVGDDCGAGRAEEQRLSRTAASADVHANREIFNALTSRRSS